MMAALCSGCGIGQARRPSADNSNFLCSIGGQIVKLGFMAGTGVDQARRQYAGEGMIKARLIARDAGVNFIFAAFDGFAHEFAIRQQGSCHRNQISIAARQHRLCHVGHVDAVRRDHRHFNMFAQPPSYTCKCGPRHHRCNSRNRTFVPSEVGGNDADACEFKPLCQGDNFVPAHPAFEHIHGGDAEDDDEILPHRRTRLFYDFQRKAHPVFVRSAIGIVAQVGFLNKE